MASLRNVDYTDREMLHIIARVADSDGIATADDIADVLDIGSKDGRSPASRVSPRLSWMRRYGFIDRVDHKAVNRPSLPSLWIITSIGDQLMHGEITKAVENAIDKNAPGTQLLIMRRLMQRSYVSGSSSVAAAVRREYEHSRAQRNGGY